ncbi:MAG: Maf family protein [Bacilli bacterium]
MVILASKSPRRIELLKQIFSSFEIIPADIDEYLYPEDQLSFVKAKAISSLYPSSLILSADTLVIKDNKVYGKPKDEEDARRMLHELSSSMHEVKTYYSIVLEEKGIYITKCVTSKVYFSSLSDELIEAYIKTKSPLDKAGAYGIQDKNFPLIDHIEGSYNNIVGFPIEEIRQDLIALGLID